MHVLLVYHEGRGSVIRQDPTSTKTVNLVININNNRIGIQLGINPFLSLWCIEFKNKEKKGLLKTKNH